MFIIVEGPPCSGKTSLVDKLRTAITHLHSKDRVAVLHGSQDTSLTTSNAQYLQKYLSPLDTYAPGDRDHVICDEWHWTYAAFKNEFNLTSTILPSSVRYVNMRMAQVGAVVVHLNPSTDVLRLRVERRNPFLAPHTRVIDHLRNVRARYVNLAHDSDRELTVLPGAVASLTTILDTAKHVESKAAEFNEWSTSLWPFYVGTRDPKGILIDLNPQQYDTIYPTPNSGESYLHRALYTLPQEDRESLGMLNAAHVTAESFISLMTTLKAPKLLALGREASMYLGEVAHTVLPHHRRTRRTYPLATQQYGELIYSALSMPSGTDLTKWSPQNESPAV